MSTDNTDNMGQLFVTFFANVTKNKQHHNLASHRDSAPTPHTAERCRQAKTDPKSTM